MTVPRQAKQGRGDGPRTYAWPPRPPHEFEVISVTSAMKSLDKPFLIGWAAKMAAECAVEDHAIIAAWLEKGDIRSAVDHIKGARFRDSGTKADRGTVVHSAIEAYIAGKPIDEEAVKASLKEKNVPAKMHKSTFGMINGVMEFLFDHEPKIHWSEATIYNREFGFAGTADLLTDCKVGRSTLPTVIDVKTSKSIYDETVMQLTAYGRGDFVGLDDGTEAKLHPKGKKYQHGIVVRPTASGKYEKAHFDLTDEAFDMFLACLKLADARQVFAQARRA